MKKIILLALVALGLVFLALWLSGTFNKVEAFTVVGWGRCEQLPNPQCGDTQGVQYQYQERGTELVCPEGYTQSRFFQNKCVKGPIWDLEYTNKIEQYLACPIDWEVYNDSQCRISQSCTLNRPVSENCGDKTVKVQGNCDGTETVTIYGGDTRRTWKVNGEEKWVEFGATVTWENVPQNSVIEWNNNGNFQVADESYVTRTSAQCETPNLCVNGASYTGDYCGWSPKPWEPEEYKPSVCTAALPNKPSFVLTRVDSTTVKATWNETDENTTGWTLSWGYSETNLPYGNGGNQLPKETTEFTVGNLLPNSKVWVELSRWNGNDCAVYSNRVNI